MPFAAGVGVAESVSVVVLYGCRLVRCGDIGSLEAVSGVILSCLLEGDCVSDVEKGL